MATINGSTNNSRYSLTCEYTYTQNASANTSTITAIVYLNGNGYTTISNYWCCTINGVQVTTNMSATVSGKTELGRRTWTVNHKSDGSCTTNISFSFTNRVTAGTYTVSRGEGSANVTLSSLSPSTPSTPTTPTNNKPSTISLNKTSFVLGTDEVKITISKKTKGVTHRIKLSWGGNWKKLVDTTATSYTFVPHKNFCNQIPNSTSGTATIKVETLLNGKWIGEVTKNVTFTVPNDVVPSVGISVTANNTMDGVNVQNRTTFTVKPTDAKGIYGSTIKSYSYSGRGYLSGNSSTGETTGTLAAGSYTFTVSVTDSRGRTAKASKKVEVYEYDVPTFSCMPRRSSSTGEPLDMGEYIYGQLTYKIYNPNNTNTNEKKYRLLSKEAKTKGWTVAKDWTDLTNYSGTETIKFGGTYSILTTYDIKIEVKDSHNLATMQYRIDTSKVVFNIEKQGIGVGKIWEQGALDVGDDAYFGGDIYIGKGKHYYGTTEEGNRIDMIYLKPSDNSVELGSSSYNTSIKSLENPRWYTSETAKAYNIWTDKDCIVSSNNICTTWRHPNGMQISVIKVSGTWNITTAWGSVYSSPHIAGQAFNVAFLEAPRVMVNAYNATSSIMVCQCSAPTTTATGACYLWKPTEQTGIKTWIEFIAIGKWK